MSALLSPAHAAWLEAESLRLLDFGRASVIPDGGFGWLDARGTIYVGSQDDHLYAVSPQGRVLWSHEMPGDVDSSVAISDGGVIVVGCDDGHLRALK